MYKVKITPNLPRAKLGITSLEITSQMDEGLFELFNLMDKMGMIDDEDRLLFAKYKESLLQTVKNSEVDNIELTQTTIKDG